MLGALWNWLSKVDPNVAIPVFMTVGGWLWSKIAGKKAETLERIVAGAIRAILAEIAENVPSTAPIETWLKGARKYVEQRIWTALAKRGVPRNKTTERIVNMLLEEATSELAERIAKEREARRRASSGSGG